MRSPTLLQKAARSVGRAGHAHSQSDQPGDDAERDKRPQRALASGKPALIDVMIDQNTLAPVVFKQ